MLSLSLLLLLFFHLFGAMFSLINISAEYLLPCFAAHAQVTSQAHQMKGVLRGRNSSMTSLFDS